METVKEGYAKKFAKKDQNEIDKNASCDRCSLPVSITDFRDAEALESYCCGSGNDRGFCQNCQDETSKFAVGQQVKVIKDLEAETGATSLEWVGAIGKIIKFSDPFWVVIITEGSPDLYGGNEVWFSDDELEVV